MFELEKKSKTTAVMACCSCKLVVIMLRDEGLINGDGERQETNRKKVNSDLEISWLEEGSEELEKRRKDFWEREK